MRSHYCGEINEQLDQSNLEICGWVHRRRDHGGVIFLDIRDRTGIVQLVFDPDTEDAFAQADRVRNEFVIRATGRVRLRPQGTVNPYMPTGKIEILGKQLEILNIAKTPPFQLDEHQQVGEDVRLKYRFIDLRRPEMNQRVQLRAKVTAAVRTYLEHHGFLDIETPILNKSTPEGARDYLVPSRIQAGAFYALPQSPQLFKQLLMMSGFDRYYQIAKCFRDEDLRADRQPEFTQIDIEASFVDEATIMQIGEGLVRDIYARVLDQTLPAFEKITYAEAMRRFGSDKPDLRIDLELVDVADLVADCDFKVFAKPANDPNGRVAALRVPQGNTALTRKEIDSLTDFVGQYGAKGLAYVKVNEPDKGREGLQSPIVKNLSEAALLGIIERTGAVAGDLIFFGADRASIVNEALGALRVRLGHDLNLVKDVLKPLWVVDFPMFEITAEGHLNALHHPFTAPNVPFEALQQAPAQATSRAYDMVLNGVELGGGSIRIHDTQMQRTVLQLLGIDDASAQQKFGFLLEALEMGCPPHGGMAFGLDRLIMLMSGATSIRDVIAFPKTQSAACLMSQAPSKVDPRQLLDVGIRLRETLSSQTEGADGRS